MFSMFRATQIHLGIGVPKHDKAARQALLDLRPAKNDPFASGSLRALVRRSWWIAYLYMYTYVYVHMCIYI